MNNEQMLFTEPIADQNQKYATEEQFADQLRTLKELRDKQESVKSLYTIAKAKFDTETAELTTEKKSIEGQIATVSDTIRSYAVNRYEQDATKSKDIGFGVKIRVEHTLSYDEQIAITWCKENAKIAVKEVLLKDIFKAIANEKPLDFVIYIETTTATLPSKIEL